MKSVRMRYAEFSLGRHQPTSKQVFPVISSSFLFYLPDEQEKVLRALLLQQPIKAIAPINYKQV